MKERQEKHLFILLKKTGIFRLWRYCHRHEIIIVMIHGVMTPEDNHVWKPLRNHLHPKVLSKTLKNLAKLYKFISIDQAEKMLSGKIPVSPYSIVLTFDDGYRNHITHALPILKKYKVPATFYISTANTERDAPFWFDRLDYAIQQIKAPALEINIGKKLITIDTSSRKKLTNSYKKIISAAKTEYQNNFDINKGIYKLIYKLEKNNGSSIMDIRQNDKWSTIMNWQEVKQAIDSGFITIGSHAVDHARLNLVDSEMTKYQLQHSKKMIKTNTGITCNHFCYPNGDWDQEVVVTVKECGYKTAVTTKHGLNKVGDNPYCLRRTNFPINHSDDKTMAIITGFWFFIVNLKNRIFSLPKIIGF